MANVAVTLQKLANEATAKTFKYNKEEAATSRAWQKEMSDTSHQREVKDLIAAGLNPVLSSGGSGAQAYSTTSASGVAESAVNAIGNYESAKTSAAATRYAAQQNAAAARYAANAQAAAARYAAALQYDSNIKGYQNQKDINDANIKQQQWQTKNAPAKNFVELIDRLSTKFGLTDVLGDSKLVKGWRNAISIIANGKTGIGKAVTTSQLFTNWNNAKSSNFVLSSFGKQTVNKALNRLDITPTGYAQRMFIKAVVFSNKSAAKWLANQYAQAKRTPSSGYHY